RTDGSPLLYGYTEVYVILEDENDNGPHFTQQQYTATVWEGNNKGTFVMQVKAFDADDGANSRILYHIVDGNHDNAFIIEPAFSGIVKTNIVLDREIRDLYSLKVIATDEGIPQMTGTTTIRIHIVDVNDNQPTFPPHKIINVSEVTGVLFVNNKLDYDEGATIYNLIIRACDSGNVSLCTLHPFRIALADENDNNPKFPVHEYIEYIRENEPIDTAIFTARATDLDKGRYGQLNYTIEPSSSMYGSDDAWKLFTIDELSGIVTTNAVFDYEERSRYDFMVKATDIGGKSAVVKVRMLIDSNDEYSPQFTERTYHFVMSPSSISYLPVGYVIGQVTATDRDKGPDGHVVYQLTSQNPYFK
uniref:Cadherin domain-containing protein n=1 Tax=Megaselia scalaris TaxID=36166 RepID=T1GTS0_MEGSC